MLRRLFVGLVLGALVGGLVGGAIVYGLGMVTWVASLSYVGAALTGALTGLVAGKPIWAQGAQIEAGLKAFFGALLAAGGLYAVRTFLHLAVSLESVRPGMTGEIGDLPLVALPLVAGVLGAIFALDDTEPRGEGARARTKPLRVAPRSRVAPGVDLEDDEELAGPSRRTQKR